MNLLEKYNELLVERNKVVNLTAHKTLEQSWVYNIQDSLLFSREIAELVKLSPQLRFLDIGSGGGSPAIPLAIELGVDMTMIDSTRKKIDFLNEVCQELNLNARAIHTRIEDHKGQYDVITARALAPMDKLVGYAMPLLKKGGVLIAYKGRNVYEEVQGLKVKYEIIEKPLDDEVVRYLVVVRG